MLARFVYFYRVLPDIMAGQWEEQSSHFWPEGLWGSKASALWGTLQQIYVARSVSVQARGYGAIAREKVREVNGSGFFDSTVDKAVKILSFEVKTPIYQGEKKDISKTLNVKPIVP